ncbi:MAG TPA: hypothetical protein VNC50_16760 [Planctomycetia bacterium]|nr:hypothetical protein [Planctomycetia bacterium]
MLRSSSQIAADKAVLDSKHADLQSAISSGPPSAVCAALAAWLLALIAEAAKTIKDMVNQGCFIPEPPPEDMVEINEAFSSPPEDPSPPS